MGGGGGGGGRDTASMPGAQTQQIFIPNALVGASMFSRYSQMWKKADNSHW
jgi:hypothetical protein